MRVFISAELSSKRGIENQTRTVALHALLQVRGFNFVDCLGVYQGHKELSFCVTVKSSNDLVRLHNIADQFGQACILIENYDKSYLYFSNGTKQDIGGRLRKVNKDDLQGRDYTLINGEYWIV